MIAYYGSKLSPHMTETPEGFLICHDVKIARTGTQNYLAREIGLDGMPERVLQVTRSAEDVFDPAAIASFEGKDVTNTHPSEMIVQENQAAYSKGHAENVRRVGDYLVADLYLKDPTLISEVKNGAMRDVSCGYYCQYEADGAGYRQTHIRGNHIAIVPRGRAGRDVAIKDSAAELPAEKGKVKHMSKSKSLLSLFGLAAKNAAPEELDSMVETAAAALDAAHAAAALDAAHAAAALDAAPAVPAQDAAPAVPAQDAGPAKDKDPTDIQNTAVLDALNNLSGKLDQLIAANTKKAEDKEPEDLDKVIAEMSGEKPGKKEEDEDESGSTTVPSEDECAKPAANDSGLALLKAMRPIINGIQDKATRDALSKTLIEQVKGTSSVDAIAKAAQDSAAAAASASGKSQYEQVCQASQLAYNERNPHMKKEG